MNTAHIAALAKAGLETLAAEALELHRATDNGFKAFAYWNLYERHAAAASAI